MPGKAKRRCARPVMVWMATALFRTGPKLAGQHAPYLERQIGLIKGGNRPVPEMAGIVISLSDQDMADLAAYFSSQTTSAGLTDEALRASR